MRENTCLLNFWTVNYVFLLSDWPYRMSCRHLTTFCPVILPDLRQTDCNWDRTLGLDIMDPGSVINTGSVKMCFLPWLFAAPLGGRKEEHLCRNHQGVRAQLWNLPGAAVDNHGMGFSFSDYWWFLQKPNPLVEKVWTNPSKAASDFLWMRCWARFLLHAQHPAGSVCWSYCDSSVHLNWQHIFVFSNDSACVHHWWIFSLSSVFFFLITFTSQFSVKESELRTFFTHLLVQKLFGKPDANPLYYSWRPTQ